MESIGWMKQLCGHGKTSRRFTREVHEFALDGKSWALVTDGHYLLVMRIDRSPAELSAPHPRFAMFLDGLGNPAGADVPFGDLKKFCGKPDRKVVCPKCNGDRFIEQDDGDLGCDKCLGLGSWGGEVRRAFIDEAPVDVNRIAQFIEHLDAYSVCIRHVRHEKNYTLYVERYDWRVVASVFSEEQCSGSEWENVPEFSMIHTIWGGV